MQFISNWIILSPLLLGLALIFFAIWKLVKEIKPALRQLKSLQKELDRASNLVSSSMPAIQSLSAQAAEAVEDGKALATEAKEAYGNVKNIVGVLTALNTAPARQAFVYIQERRKNRLNGLQEKWQRWKKKSSKYGRELLERTGY